MTPEQEILLSSLLAEYHRCERASIDALRDIERLARELVAAKLAGWNAVAIMTAIVTTLRLVAADVPGAYTGPVDSHLIERLVELLHASSIERLT